MEAPEICRIIRNAGNLSSRIEATAWVWYNKGRRLLLVLLTNLRSST